jgi:hypothetical protein
LSFLFTKKLDLATDAWLHAPWVGAFARALKGEDSSSTLCIEVDDEALVILCVADGHGGAEAALHSQFGDSQFIIP